MLLLVCWQLTYLPDGPADACKNDVRQIIRPNSQFPESLHHTNLDAVVSIVIKPEQHNRVFAVSRTSDDSTDHHNSIVCSDQIQSWTGGSAHQMARLQQ